MRCLYCGKQLALLRRLTGSTEFCSEAHKLSYNDEYNKLALSRLQQAQSRPDDIKPTSPHEPAAASREVIGDIEESKSAIARDPASEWTTVQQGERKRLRVAATAKDTPETPAKPGFLLDKPALRSSETVLEPHRSELLSVHVPLPPADVCRPTLNSKPVEHQASTPPRAGDLLKLTSVGAVPIRSGARRTGLAEFQQPMRSPQIGDCSIGLEICAGFASAGLLTTQIDPVPLLRTESELEAPLTFQFNADFDELATVCFIAGGSELPNDQDLQFAKIANAIPEEVKADLAIETEEGEYELAGLLRLTVRPKGPRNLEPTFHRAPLSIVSSAPVLPVNSPLPLGREVAEPGPDRARAAHLGHESATPALVAAKAPIKHEPTSKPAGKEVDVRALLKGPKTENREQSLWRNVQKYLKNIVSCLIIASVGGGLYWHFRIGPVFSVYGLESDTSAAHLASTASEPSGPADRARSRRQVFVLPFSIMRDSGELNLRSLQKQIIEWERACSGQISSAGTLRRS